MEGVEKKVVFVALVLMLVFAGLLFYSPLPALELRFPPATTASRLSRKGRSFRRTTITLKFTTWPGCGRLIRGTGSA